MPASKCDEQGRTLEALLSQAIGHSRPAEGVEQASAQSVPCARLLHLW